MDLTLCRYVIIHVFAAILRVKAVSAGLVVIKGLKTALYLAMDKDGHVFASVSACHWRLHRNYHHLDSLH